MPNGNVASANDNVNGNWSYGYDDFNRLSSSSKTGAAYTYDYDRYGNRWHQNGPTTNLLSFSSANNRIDGFVYDAAGNVLNDGQGHTFTYDAENRVIGMGSDVAYAYDGDGRRIRKTVSGVSTDFLYDLEDHVISEMNSSGVWDRGEIFAAGRHLATYALSTTFFSHADWQGTERARTALSGAVSETCSSLPFGDALSCSGTETSPDHFTGKEHDDESGLDYFGARYYGSNLGRFMSSDWADKPEAVPYSDFHDPQSLNLYGYVRNNPMSRTDPDGHCPPCVEEILDSPAAQEIIEKASPYVENAVGVVVGVAATAWAASHGYFDKAATALQNAGPTQPGPYVGPLQNESSSDSMPKSASGQSTPADPNGNVPKPPSGKGSVPKNQRDEKRLYTKADKTKKLNGSQKGKCAQCGEDLKPEDAIGHHKKRWADGGQTDDENLGVLCDPCHDKLHKK